MIHKIFFHLAFAFPLFLSAQFIAPQASQAAETMTTVGYTDLTVNYHRPGIHGRIIFGGLLPYEKVWRAGANENTLLTVTKPVTIGGTKIMEGSYSLYLIPRATGQWTWIINAQTENWGTNCYDASKDLVRVNAAPKRLPERIESLEYRWMNLTHHTVDLVMEWEWNRLTLPIDLDTDAQVALEAAATLNPADDANDYYEAARYYLENDNLKLAKTWITRWAAASDEQFGRTRRQALIEYRLGNAPAARRLMSRSIELAREAGNDHYVRMGEQSLKEWTRTPTEISPDTLLARSIAYHDPDNKWTASSHMLNLAESRPDGGVRHSRVTLYPAGSEFDLYQIRGRNKINMRYLDGKYQFSHQGRTEISDSVRAQLNLTEERTDLLRDYYTYLYGLPMKLRDPAAQLGTTVHRVWYDNRELLELPVDYGSGQDKWTFFFDPETYALSGYRFHHADQPADAGEYILLEGEAKIGGMRLPKIRHWYEAKENLYLGTDEILE